MQANGFDISSPLKWGFYFTDGDETKLRLVYAELESSSYVLEGISRIDDNKYWTLFASKIDILTPEKLHRRNLAFNELANYCAVELYDGWDVERINHTE